MATSEAESAATAAVPSAQDVHRYACLRRRAVRATISQVRHNLAVKNAAAGDASDAGPSDSQLMHEILSAGCSCSENIIDVESVERSLSDYITFVRSDGTILLSAASSLNSGSNGANNSNGTSTCLLVLKNGKEAKQTEDNTRKQQQVATAARLIGEALVQLGQSQAAHHDSNAARAAGKTVAAAAHQSSSSANDSSSAEAEAKKKSSGVIWSAASGLASAVTSTVWYALSAVAGGEDDDLFYKDDVDIGSAGNADHAEDAFYAHDIINDDDYAPTVQLCGEYDDAAQSSSKGGNKNNNQKSAVLLDEEKDYVLNVRIVCDCIKILLQHAEGRLAAGHHHDGESGAILLYRFGAKLSSVAEFCKLAAAAADNGNVLNAASRAQHQTLAKLTPSDIDLMLLGMVSAGYAVLSSDGDIVAIVPQGGAVSVDGDKSTSSPLNDVDIAIFRLQSTISTLERRIDYLSDQANGAQSRAVMAKKQNKSSALAVTHLKRRNLLRAEAEKTSTTLLNIEHCLQSLQRAKADAEVVKAYKLAGEAMKIARTSEEEGGLGLNADNVENLMDDIAEVGDELEEVGDLLATDAAGGSGAVGGGGDIDEEELVKEIEQLEVDILADGLASSSLKEGAEVASKDNGVSNAHIEKVDEKVEKGTKETEIAADVATAGKKEAVLVLG